MRSPEPNPPALVDAAEFRRALGQFATGVTVVTALDPASGRPEGVTVNAFASLSLEPPLVLVCLARTTRLALLLDSAGHFAVNVLAADQRFLSVAFARADDDRFAGVAWRAWASGAPILEGCVANLECARAGRNDGGDHVIVVGRVERLAYDETREPLLFARSDYRGLGGMLP
jgi:flavin reductase (DIM6/NTAB) family NADH-FMN oxidoreductase RutF